MKVGLEPSTETVPESSVKDARLTRSKNTQSLADTNLDIVRTKSFLNRIIFLDEKKSHCTKTRCSEDC